MWFRANEKELQALFDGISNVVRQTLQDTLLGSQSNEHSFVHQIRSEVKQEMEKMNMALEPSPSPLKEMIEQYLNRNVEINTPAGMIEGLIAEVGDDYVEIHETESMIVIVQLENAISLQPR